MRPADEKLDRLLTFRSGGWVIAGALLISTLLVAWAMAGIFLRTDRPAGNGRDIDTYGFDLTALSVPRSIVRPAMPRRDMVHPMDDPPLVTGEEVAGCAGIFVRTKGELVLCPTRNIEFPCEDLCGLAHVEASEGIGESEAQTDERCEIGGSESEGRVGALPSRSGSEYRQE